MIELPKQLEELRNKKIWLNYVMVWNPTENRYNKPPVNPHTLQMGSSTDPERWATFDEAVRQVGKIATVTDRSGKQMSEKIAGVGLVLEPMGLVGVDFDHVMGTDKDGKIVVLDKTAQELWTYLDSYREISPSGTGVHVLVKGKKPGKICKVSLSRTASDGSVFGVDYEIYDKGRYFTFTGRKPKRLESGLEDRQAQLDKVYRYIEIQHEKQEKERGKAPKKSLSVASCSGGSGARIQASETDEELWEKMFNSKKGDIIRRLYNGQIDYFVEGGKNNGQPDHSRADSALCAHLAYWTNNDVERIDRMFRQSGLMRDKWEKRADYRSRTIERATRGNGTYHEYTAEERRAYAKQKEEEERKAISKNYRGGR